MRVVTLCASCWLAGCAAADGPGRKAVGWVPDAVPRAEPISRRGNPDSYVHAGQRYFVMPTARGYRERGVASWYGKKFHGRETSSGELYDMYAMTAAHKTLPLPTYVRVTNLKNGRSVVVKVNDRGPFAKNRIIDLSYAAAHKLDMIGDGTAQVEVTAVHSGDEDAGGVIQARHPGARDWRDESHLRDRIYVQVGAFSARRNAERVLERLTAARVDNVQILESTDPRETARVVHRVRVGPLHTVTATDRLMARLESLGYADCQVVIE